MVTKITRLNSIVFKTIIFLLEFFIFSIIVLVFALMYGIKLNNLSFSGINIGELYLKYDKKLFVHLHDFDYGGKRLDCNLSVGGDSQNYIVDIENFYYQNLKMNFYGKVVLSDDQLDKLIDGKKKDVTVDDASVTFDQALKPVLAKKLFLGFDKDITIRFFKPSLDGVKLDNSTIDIVDLASDGVLKIYLDIYNMLDIRVLKVLGNYEVDLPLKQVGGETHTFVSIDIPFSSEKGINIKADAKVKNGVITIGDNNLNVKHTPPNPNSKTKVKVSVELENNTVVFDDFKFKSDKLFVDYENKVVKISSKQNKLAQKDAILATIENINGKLQNNIFSYGVDIKDPKQNFVTIIGDTNLNKQTTNGELYLNRVGYENKVSLENEKISFAIQHKPLNVALKGDFGVNVQLENNQTKKVGFDNLHLGFQNNIVNLNTNITQDKNLFTLHNISNLDNNRTFGDIVIIKYNQPNLIDVENQTVHYDLNHRLLQGDITSNLALNITNRDLFFDNLKLHYQDKIATVKIDILEGNNSLRLENTTNLDTNISLGNLYINQFKHNDLLRITHEKINYKVVHEPLVATIASNLDLYLFDKEKKEEKKISFVNLFGRFEDNKIFLDSDIKEGNNSLSVRDETDLDSKKSFGKLSIDRFQYENIAFLENQTIKYDLTHEPLKVHLFSDLNLTLLAQDENSTDKKINLNQLDLLYNDKNILNLKTDINEGNSSLYITNATNLETKKANGTLLVKSFQFSPYLDLKDEFMKYKVDFFEGIKVDIESYLLTFIKDLNNKQTLKIGRFNKLLGKINLIEDKKIADGSLYLTTPNNFKEATILINDLGIDINTTLFTQNQTQDENNTKEDNKTAKDLPKIALKLFNTNVTVDNYDLNSSKIYLNTNKQHIDLEYLPQDENATIKFLKNGDIISLKVKDLSEKFVENFAKKDLFDGGLFTIDIDGNKTNLYGGVYVKDTTVKNVQILNNLITFINTTPAIITPILALPTLFRMGETGFDMTGYPVRDGHLKFDYHYKTKMLQLPSFYTRSKMMDFKGKGYVDITKRNQAIGIDVIFLKDYSKFFNHIPIVGYVITGDDGNFVTNVDINGTFENPDFTTHAVSNAAEGVVNMIKRTITLPFLPFMDDGKKRDNNQSAPENKKEIETLTNKEGN